MGNGEPRCTHGTHKSRSVHIFKSAWSARAAARCWELNCSGATLVNVRMRPITIMRNVNRTSCIVEKSPSSCLLSKSIPRSFDMNAVIAATAGALLEYPATAWTTCDACTHACAPM